MKTRMYIMDTESLRDLVTAGRIYQALPEIRRKKADKYRLEDDRLRSLASGALLLKLCEDEHLPAGMNDLTENAYGKPFFSGLPEVCFSLSHSGSKVILAVSDRAIGCDIEVVRDTPIADQIARRFYSAEEYEALRHETNPELRCRLFYRLWTLRESFVKQTGLGLYLPLRSFRIQIGPEDIAAVQLTEPLDKEYAEFVSENVSFFEYNLGTQYCCSCCILQGDTPCKKPELIPVQI